MRGGRTGGLRGGRGRGGAGAGRRGDGDGVFLGLDEPVADGAPIHEAGMGTERRSSRPTYSLPAHPVNGHTRHPPDPASPLNQSHLRSANQPSSPPPLSEPTRPGGPIAPNEGRTEVPRFTPSHWPPPTHLRISPTHPASAPFVLGTCRSYFSVVFPAHPFHARASPASLGKSRTLFLFFFFPRVSCTHSLPEPVHKTLRLPHMIFTAAIPESIRTSSTDARSFSNLSTSPLNHQSAQTRLSRQHASFCQHLSSLRPY